MFTYAINEKFDRKADTRIIRAFFTGNENQTMQRTWVCIPEGGSWSTIPSLFSETNETNDSLVHVENELLRHCYPLTIGQ